MTLKQMKIAKAIPKAKTMKEAGRLAGYSLTAGNIYNKAIKSHIAESIGYDPKAIIKAYEDLIRRCKEDNDKSNERQAYDSLSRINAMFTDKSKLEVTEPKDSLVLKRYE